MKDASQKRAKDVFGKGGGIVLERFEGSGIQVWKRKWFMDIRVNWRNRRTRKERCTAEREYQRQ